MEKQNSRPGVHDGQMWIELMEICVRALAKLPGSGETRLLNFWTYRGGGKTTFLHGLMTALAAPDVAIAGLWDAATLEIERSIQEILHVVETLSEAKKVVLLDNLDHLLRVDDGNRFFEFERQLVLSLLEREDVLLITTSQIPITQWREYDTRIHQENHLIPALNADQVKQLAEMWSLDAVQLFTLSQGYPGVFSWLRENPAVTDIDLAQHLQVDFLADLSAKTRELAAVASLLPVFDITILRDIAPIEESTELESLYADYMERLREMLRLGLVAWDMHIGAYRFCNAAIRCLLARSFQILYPGDFERVHQQAATYYQAEARRAGYLHYVLVSALYHMAWTRYVENPLTVGNNCLNWVHENIGMWMGADWKAVLKAWQDGAGDKLVREELQVLLGEKVMNEITQSLDGAKHAMEVLQ